MNRFGTSNCLTFTEVNSKPQRLYLDSVRESGAGKKGTNKEEKK
jgi:hypothetical protein